MRKSLVMLAVAGLCGSLGSAFPVSGGGERISRGYRGPAPRRGRSGNMPPAKRLLKAAEARRKGVR